MTRLQQIAANILDQLLEQSNQVQSMVQFGLESIEERCVEAVKKTQEIELTVNAREIQIEEECLRTLALYQPKASDLRLLATILKVNGDLERIADLALNLTERAEALEEFPSVEIPSELADMVRYSLKMVQDAHKALLDRNVNLAHSICQRDDQLDAMNRELIIAITKSMKQTPEMVEAQLHIFSASRIVERIGDHATNIAEDVLYLVDGEIQRHQHKLPELFMDGVSPQSNMSLDDVLDS